MTSTQLKVLAVALLAVVGLFLWSKYVLPLGARVLPAILITGWIYLIARPISGAWRKLGPTPTDVLNSFAVKAFVALWMLAALAFAARVFITGASPDPSARDFASFLFFSLTAPFWWAFACALAMLFRRAA